jgi:peptidoglycan/xylan/chitin deacetylase (PgdA/CDA1 family)
MMSRRTTRELAPVLLYHEVVAGRATQPWQVSVAMLAADLDAVLESGRSVVTASTLDAALSGPVHHDNGLCALTFDDGDAGFLDLVVPMLVERGLAATLYVTTGGIGQPGRLSTAGLADVVHAGMEVGAHTVLHRDLDILSCRSIRRELHISRDHLAEVLGRAPRSFAYPHGTYHRAICDLVRGAGYANAYAIKNALTHDTDDRYARARLFVQSGTPRRRVQAWLAGRGAPVSWRRERLRTKAFRHLRGALAPSV